MPAPNKSVILNSLRSKGGFTFISRSERAFTLIELMVTIAIIAVISAIGITSYSQSQKLARDTRRKNDLRSLAVALELFRQKNGRYPCAKSPWNSWVYSSDPAPWITDLTACTSSGSNINMEPTYTAKLPIDPINSGNPMVGGTGYGYAYWSGNPGAGGNCVNAVGQAFTLVARLENTNDRETAQNAATKTCDGVTTYYPGISGSYRPEDFVIISP